MYLNIQAIRNHNLGLVATTVIAVVVFAFIAINLLPQDVTEARIQNIKVLKQGESELSFDTIFDTDPTQWEHIDLPINLGLKSGVYWFSFEIPTPKNTQSQRLLHFNYASTDQLDVAIYSSEAAKPLVSYQAGDSIAFNRRPIAHTTPLFPLPTDIDNMRAVIRIESQGNIRLPISVWEESEFIVYTSSQNLVMGLCFGFLCAMGISNLFLFFTTKSRSFLYYAGYVFSLALALASLDGFGYAHLWPNQVWFQSRSLLIFGNATVLLGLLFTRNLLPIASHSPPVERLLQFLTWLFGINIIIGYFLPYAIFAKLYMLMLCIVIVLIIGICVWLVLKGVVVAAYFSVAWSFLFISGIITCLDNISWITLSFPSGYLLMIGIAIESLILSLILAISYSHSRDEIIDAQEFALAQEVKANKAKADLLDVQQRYQNDLEYKVEERTLELDIALRELTEVNQELERLTAIDALTGINNRRHFDKRLKFEGRRSRRERTPLSLAIIDADHFKNINDNYGHAGGDACLIHIARVIQKAINRPTDDICRIGGEEFALILPNTDQDGAAHVVEAIRASIESALVSYEGQSIKLTVSAGVATSVIENDEQPQILFRKADELLYTAKASGRNRVAYQSLTG